MSEETPEVVTKNWKSIGVFSSYGKALAKRIQPSKNTAWLKLDGVVEAATNFA